MWNLPTRTIKNGPERCIAIVGNERMEEKSAKQGRVEARFEGGQGLEGAVVPYMDMESVIAYFSRRSMMYKEGKKGSVIEGVQCLDFYRSISLLNDTE
jgi:hypothetical protein